MTVPSARRLACALLLGLALAATARAGDIVIGMSAAFTGPSRGLGIELYRGAQAWFQEVNSKGGVHGRRLVIRAYDDPVVRAEKTFGPTVRATKNPHRAEKK